MPTRYALSQNYPNPFNPETRISYDIISSGMVSIIVYDILGRKIVDLVNEIKVPGRYNVCGMEMTHLETLWVVEFICTSLNRVNFQKLERWLYLDEATLLSSFLIFSPHFHSVRRQRRDQVCDCL